MEQDAVILSPEKTIITYRLAGLGSRIIAHLVDILLIIGLVMVVNVIIAFTFFRVDPVSGQGLLLLISFVVPLLYFILLEGLWNGQTPGKKAFGIRVRMTDGTPITFGAAIGRNLLRPADMLPISYLAGLLATFTNPRAQRIGDLVANTVVCYEKRSLPNFTIAPHVVGIHPFENQVGELRGMTIEEYHALRRFADRFPELSTNIQIKLTNEVFQPIAERRGIPNPPNIHPIYLAEAVVMKYGRKHGIL